MDAYLNLLKDDESKELDIDMALESLYDGASKAKSIMRIIGKQISRFFQFIIAQIKLFFGWIGKFIAKVVGRLPINGKAIISDTFGLVDNVNTASPLINEYIDTINRLYDLDHQEGKSLKMADAIKYKLKKAVIGGPEKEPQSIRIIQEDINLAFKRADEIYDNLNHIFENVTTFKRAVKNPKNYTKDDISKIISTRLNGPRKKLMQTHERIKASAETYKNEASFMWKMSHKKLIAQNTRILKHSQNLMDLLANFINLMNDLANTIIENPITKEELNCYEEFKELKRRNKQTIDTFTKIETNEKDTDDEDK